MKSSLLVFCLLTLTAAAQAQNKVLMVADFETGDVSQLGTQKAQSDSISIVTSPVRAGKHAAKTLLRASDPEVNGGQRAEFSDGKKGTVVEMEKDYWYGLSIFLPEDFTAPTKSDAVLFQWHTQQGGPSPVLAIRVKAGEWVITHNATEKKRTLVRIPLVKERWTDWVVHVRWSAEKKGFLTIWKDGVEVVKETDIITQYPEALGPYAKFGQYHSVSEVPQNVVYFDEYRVAGAEGSFAAVSPPVSSAEKK
jgi:polysaccharide lyase-like protein